MAKRKASGTPKAPATRKPSSTARKAARRSTAKVATRKTVTTRDGKPPRTGAKKPASTARTSAKARRPAAGARRPSTGKAETSAKKKAVKRASKPAGTAARAARTPKPAPRRRDREEEMVPSPPSSLDMKRRGSAARTGRDEMAEARADHATMTPSITGGDVDASVEDAYFTGDEAPGGDNTTPDQDIVDDIGKALGVEYQDNEELRGSDKVADRDKHRWELDPASAEDYRDRK
ncbi:MAG TPA: DUF6335 family protein [Vicinamibacterales bacterium]|nr:DUF6335 family protein [Vicinamibacterales bacterium]